MTIDTSSGFPGLVVLPGAIGRSATVNARMLAAAGLARAIGHRLGGVDVLTPRGLIGVDDLESVAVRENTVRSAGRAVAHRLPSPVRSAVGDVRVWRQDRVIQKLAARSLNGRYRFVLQFHRRFQSAGIDAARRAGVAFVLRVEALEIREEASWGVRRNGYGRLVERLGELRIMHHADLIASVSDVLDGQLEAVGIPRDKRVVIPNGVDIDKFSPGVSDPELRRRHGLDGRFAIGWVGGFRPFHGLEMVPEFGSASAGAPSESAPFASWEPDPCESNSSRGREGLKIRFGSFRLFRTGKFRCGSAHSTPACSSERARDSTTAR